MSTRRRLAWTAALGLCAAVVCFRGLAEAPVYITNEAREGVYARAMLRSGDFVAPPVPSHVENGEVVADKPPLFHWIAAAATWARAWLTGMPSQPGEELAGTFDEWTLRFPSALAGSVLVVAVALLGAPLVGTPGALIGAAALLTSPQFVVQARLGRVDMLFACLVTLSGLLAARAGVDGRALLLPAAAAASGLAVLAKGPLGALLPALACAAAAFARSAPPRQPLPWRKAIAALLIVAAPWYVLASVSSGGAVIRSQLFAENLDQFSGANGRMPATFYLGPWLTDSFPWNLAALAALGRVWRRRPPGATFCALWWLAIVGVFQLAAYKRRAYLLPALPAEALLAGWWIDGTFLAGRRPAVLGKGGLLSLVGTTLVVSLLAALAGAALGVGIARSGLGADLSPGEAALLAAGAAASARALVALVRAAQADDRWGALVALWIGLGAVCAAVIPSGVAFFARRLSAKGLVGRIEAALPAGETLRVCGIGSDLSLVVLFHLHGPDRVREPAGGMPCPTRPEAGFYLLAKGDWSRVVRSDAAAGRGDWRELLEGELRGWTSRHEVILAEMRPAGAEGAADQRVSQDRERTVSAAYGKIQNRANTEK